MAAPTGALREHAGPVNIIVIIIALLLIVYTVSMIICKSEDMTVTVGLIITGGL